MSSAETNDWEAATAKAATTTLVAAQRSFICAVDGMKHPCTSFSSLQYLLELYFMMGANEHWRSYLAGLSHRIFNFLHMPR